MKSIIVACAAALSFFVSSCSSENKQDKMYDTSVGADSDFINLDTGRSLSDTIGTDSMNNTEKGINPTSSSNQSH